MIIISHRGYWHEVSEKNSLEAFRRSFKHNFGVETDVRDCMGELLISHDIPRGSELPLNSFLSLLEKQDLLLAINIKSDGLAIELSKAMKSYNRANWFVFDMSIPDMREHIKLGNPVFARMSEVEKVPVWFDLIEGVWLDSFDKEWFDSTFIKNLIDEGKRVCIVSPELHRRNHIDLWTMLKPLAKESQLILCTDFPEQARDFFTRYTL